MLGPIRPCGGSSGVSVRLWLRISTSIAVQTNISVQETNRTAKRKVLLSTRPLFVYEKMRGESKT
jgi:hypothetical protein